MFSGPRCWQDSAIAINLPHFILSLAAFYLVSFGAICSALPARFYHVFPCHLQSARTHTLLLFMPLCCPSHVVMFSLSANKTFSYCLVESLIIWHRARTSRKTVFGLVRHKTDIVGHSSILWHTRLAIIVHRNMTFLLQDQTLHVLSYDGTRLMMA